MSKVHADQKAGKNMDDGKALIDQCIKGSATAWRHFTEKFSPFVYYVIQKVVNSKCPDISREEINDLHNDIFVSIMEKNGRKLRQYEGKNGCSVATWIRIIAVRATIDFLRKRRPMLSLSDAKAEKEAEKQSTSDTTPLKILEGEEKKNIIKELLEDLSPKDQLFMRLLYYEEASPREIAKILNSTPNAVYSRGNFLREKLKKSLKKKLSKK